jgi:hypothetical protein
VDCEVVSSPRSAVSDQAWIDAADGRQNANACLIAEC